MRKKIRRKHMLAAGVLAFGLWAFISPNNDRYFEILKNLDIFTTLYKEVNAHYVDDINPNTFMRTGIDAMMEALDPYTRFYPEDQIEDVRTENTGEYGGIGAVVEDRKGKVMITMPNKGFAADRAGLKRGDEIIAINNLDVRGQYEKAGEYLRGQSASSVKIKVDRQHVGELEFDVELERIELPNVSYYGMLNEEIGIIKQTGFTEGASKEVKNALKELKKQGATRIVLDLRGNLGGLLSEAVNISNIFIPKGELVVTTEGKLEETNATYKTLNTPTDTEIPLAVLINSTSASASEIVAGVMQDYDRGILVGRKSYGKGLVQRTIPLSYNAQMKVTIAKYYIPSRRSIQAIDYANRNPDGSVGKIADSLKTAFKTANGRIVYDGGGIDPDFMVEKQKLAPVTIGILSEDLLFDFGNGYGPGIGEIRSVKDFEITDIIFNDFKAWLADKAYDYSTPLQKEISQLKVVAEETDELLTIQSQIDALERLVGYSKEKDLEANAEEIRHLLKEEFVSRALLEEGQIAVSYQYDKDIVKVMEVLSDLTLYHSTLSGN